MRIRYYGHFGQSSGYGQAARRLACALVDRDLMIELKAIGPGTDWPMSLAGIRRPIADPDAIIVHTLPGDCHRVIELEGLGRPGRGPTPPRFVAYTTWEGLGAPREIVERLYDNFDEVWAPSAATAMALGENGRHESGRDREEAMSSTRVIPHCYDDSSYRPRSARPDRDRFRFYWIGKWSARKNPGGLIRAFALSFRHDDDVELVLHSPGCPMETFVATLASTGLQLDELPKITLSNQHLPDEAIRRMHDESDCFVTAARGESWNLPAFDAMLAGRHVIAQGGLGSDEFLAGTGRSNFDDNLTSADLFDGWPSPAQVDVAPVQADDGSITMKTTGAQGLTSRSMWLEPNLVMLARMMRETFLDRKRTLTINYDPAERFGYAAVANLVLNALENP